ncbi:MAG: hypothetical protein ACXWDI_14825 [Nocardioides sp.]
MTRHRIGLQRAGALAMVACVLSSVSACSSDDPAAAPGTNPTASGSASSSPSEASETPEPEGPETPATTSGSLSQRSFPRPNALGAEWEYAVDPGDAEEGYAGNGTPTLERDPREIVQLAVPFGCARPSPMPTPTHALEVDYTAEGVKVIAIRGNFDDEATAKHFFTARKANLERCLGRSGGQAIGTIVAQAETLRRGVLLNDRTPDSDPWAELAVLDGDQVVLVAAQTNVDSPPMTPSGVRRLAALFQG